MWLIVEVSKGSGLQYSTTNPMTIMLVSVFWEWDFLIVKWFDEMVYPARQPSTIVYVQWDLSIKDTLGPANLSTVKRLSTFQRWKMY